MLQVVRILIGIACLAFASGPASAASVVVIRALVPECNGISCLPAWTYGTGVGAPFAAWLIADALKKPSVPTPEPPAPVVTPAEDSESDYELRLWRE